MTTAYIPRKDGSFDAWERHFASYLTDHFLELGLTVEEVTAVKQAMPPC